MRIDRWLPGLLPLAVGAVSLAITGWLWTREQATAQRTLKAEFDFGVRQTASRILERMATYEQMLRGVQGLFIVDDPVDRPRFEGFVDAQLTGAEAAGIQWFGHAPLRTVDGKPAAPVAMVAPATPPNLKAVGDDPLADPVRQPALALSGDSAGLGITPRVAGLAEPGRATQIVFQMALPVYRAGSTLDSVARRRAALSGWVLASIRMADLMSSLHGESTPGIEVHIHDGVDVSGHTLMYESHPGRVNPRPGALAAQEYLGFAGHTWTLEVRALPEFEQRFGSDTGRILLLAGGGFSLLLALLTWQLVAGRQRAHAAALAMTHELRASEERYRGIVQTADEGIWMLDAAGRTSFVNPKLASMLGHAEADMMGRTMADFAAGGAPESPSDGAGRAPTLPGAPRELGFQRRDGSTLWASIATTPIRDAQGQPSGTLAMVTDITDKRHAEAARAALEAQLRESQKMEAVGTLAGGIAHDFNNILAAILGNVDLVRAQSGLDAATAARLEQIHRSALRARSLVQQILAFSRRQPHSLVVQPLRPLVEETVRLLRPLLPALIELDVVLPAGPMDVRADATQLQQVVMNLCTNAWHALEGQAGRIGIELEALMLEPDAAERLGLPNGACARLRVSDNGCGMDEATRARLFEPFFTTKPVGQGTGLGLAVVHGIVTTHGGVITVDSAPGKGSRFDVYLPLAAAAADVHRVSIAAPDAPPARGHHVLYIDDDPAMVVLVQALLDRAGYRATGFEDPREAMAVLQAQPDAYDLVVTDYNMPALSGVDVAREVARLRPQLPVIISSGFLSEDILAAAAAAGVRGVLQKEFTLEQLADTVRRVLGHDEHD